MDALTLSIRALGIGAGDEVIVPTNTYIATVLAVTANQAIPVFVEPDEYYNLDPARLKAVTTSRTRAILAVHLYGQAAAIGEIAKFAWEHNLYLLEDCAQSHGAIYDGQMTGTFGQIGCFSFYPTKNLGAFGDAGAVVTNDERVAEVLRKLRNYGSRIKYHNEIMGVNSRMDEIQAAMLDIKLKHLDELNIERQAIASIYKHSIKNPAIILPKQRERANHVYHQFVVRTKRRNEFQAFLKENGIETVIHYPVPPHLAECFQWCGYQCGDFPITEQYSSEVLSLPMFNGETEAEARYVAEVCNRWLE